MMVKMIFDKSKVVKVIFEGSNRSHFFVLFYLLIINLDLSYF